MKRFISLLIPLLIAVNIDAATLYTPNGKAFQTIDGNYPSYNADWFAAWKASNFGQGKAYPNSEVLGEWENGLWEYNCHVFSWNNWQGAERWSSESDMWKLGKPSPYNLMWRSYPDVWYTDSDNPIGIISYISSSVNEAAVCTYSGNHSARIIGEGTRYISKWGYLPIVKHPPTEVPSIYGSVNAYYKINPAYRPVGNGDPAGRNWQTISNALNGIPTGGLIAVLSGTQTLTANILIPSGVTLRLNSGTTLNLNGYWLKPGNGTITKLGSINPDIRLIRSGQTIGYYPSTAMAAADAATGDEIKIYTNETWSSNFTSNCNITVMSGTVTVASGKTISFASGKKLTVNGSISANGTSSQKITFQSISGTWYGIEVNYGGYRPFNYCIIKNATCGIRAYQTSNLYVENCEITNNTNGLTFDNQSSGYVRYSKINSNLGNSGINCSQNSNPIIRSYNQLKNNAPAGLYGDYNSLPELGSWANYGNNSIVNSYDDVWSENSNSVYALYNYWGSSSPNPGVSSNVVWQPYLTSDPTGGGLLKPLADNAAFVFDNPAADTTGKSEFAKAYLVYLSGDYTGAMVLFKELVTKYPETAAGLQALALTDYCHQNLDNAIASLSYLNQVGASYAGKEISGLAQSIAVGHLVKLESYQEAITKSDQILQAFPDKDLAKYALYDLGTIYWYFKADHKTGEKYYRQLITAYPDDDLASSALATLGEWQPGSQPKPEAQPMLANKNEVPSKFTLEQNYPNPFNPETVINYQLAAASTVTLLIYNLRGQKIRTLIDEEKAAGSYSVQWNGKDDSGFAVASGIYVYLITAGEFRDLKKMVLVR